MSKVQYRIVALRRNETGEYNYSPWIDVPKGKFLAKYNTPDVYIRDATPINTPGSAAYIEWRNKPEESK